MESANRDPGAVDSDHLGKVHSCAARPSLLRAVFQAFLLATIMFVSLGGYLLVLRWRGNSAEVITWIPADDWFPFWPSWVWVYLIPYIIGPILVGTLSPATFWWFIRSGLVVVAITLAIFIMFPTQTSAEHRSADVGTGLTAALFTKIIEIDNPPANAAPSLHVSLTCLLLLALLRDYPRAWAVWCAFIIIVWFSTLVTRQHHLIDVGTGILLAVVVAVTLRPSAVSRV